MPVVEAPPDLHVGLNGVPDLAATLKWLSQQSTSLSDALGGDLSGQVSQSLKNHAEQVNRLCDIALDQSKQSSVDEMMIRASFALSPLGRNISQLSKSNFI